MFARDFRARAREALSGKWMLAVGTGLVASILGSGSDVEEIFNLDIKETFDTFQSFEGTVSLNEISGLLPFAYGAISLALLLSLALFVLGSAIRLGYCKFNIRLISKTGAEFDDLFSYFKVFGKALLLRIITGLYTLLWTLLLIIPGIIASYRYAMAPYIMAEDTSLTASEAIERSKEVMDGHKWRLFCLDISFIGWNILAALSFGIGFLWLIPYTEASRAAFYIDLRGDNQGEQEYEGINFI